MVGGGWAGFGAAHALMRSNLPLDVVLLEAAAEPGGLAAGWRSARGLPVEAGIHGFWRNYANIDRLVKELRIDPFTPYTPSALHTRRGLAVKAPVLGALPRLPAPLGTALWPTFNTISLADQLTAGTLLPAFFDFDGSDAAWRRWDGMTARELFRGLSPRLYEEFIEPMLLVLPMCPGEDCSAAAVRAPPAPLSSARARALTTTRLRAPALPVLHTQALSLFSFFALEHQPDFDVRWLRASASASIFRPWAEQLAAASGRSAGGPILRIAYGKRLTDLDVQAAGAKGGRGGAAPPRVTAVRCADGEVIACDAVVSAVGISAARRIASSAAGIQGLPQRADFAALAQLRAVDVVAVRLWLTRRLSPECASNVCGSSMAPGLEQVGFTVYDLNALGHVDAQGAAGSLVEVDFYYAKALLGMADEEVVRTALAALRRALPSTYGALTAFDVSDSAVVRAPAAVSHFAPGCYEHLPAVQSRALANWFWAGDWVDRGGHRSWSQEKALVTGLQAARCATAHVLGDGPARRVQQPLDVEADEPHVALGRDVARALRAVIPTAL